LPEHSGTLRKYLRASGLCVSVCLSATDLSAQELRKDVENCRYEGWSKPERVGPALNRIVDFAGIAIGAPSPFVVVSRRGVNGQTVTGPRSGPALEAFTAQGLSLGSITGPRHFLHPRAVVDNRGDLHVVWGEPARDSPSAQAVDPPDLPVSSLWHAVLRARKWSKPAAIYTREGIQWDMTQTSRLLTDVDGGLRIGFPLIAADVPGGVVSLRYMGSRWTASLVPAPMPPVYSDLAPQPNGRAIVSYIAAAPVPGERVFLESAVLVATSSNDRGAWNASQLVGGRETIPAFEPRLITSTDGVVHLVWTQHASGSNQTIALWHTQSSDAGRTWTKTQALALTAQIRRTVLATDRCGNVHAAFQIVAPTGPRIGYTRVVGGKWTEFARPFHERDGTDPVLWVDSGGAIKLGFTESTAGLRQLRVATLSTRPRGGK
jgi:hypothetical protein